ncbi:hypothetical protein CROQUDRAFT_97642 [Cronartium quercuum f. sp. fusiforme G11]|uniref:Uncharacterized protein n=1 Tax=Cronartium quercuum f. sp. fusiforme G11 TaxID=708437 RepID=A0A9P6N9Z8_9BASI|nr:hypothetical protein CROQUDRAFT_97642 [Cronartium quercuum f. sp. fusiforme G11]
MSIPLMLLLFSRLVIDCIIPPPNEVSGNSFELEDSITKVHPGITEKKKLERASSTSNHSKNLLTPSDLVSRTNIQDNVRQKSTLQETPKATEKQVITTESIKTEDVMKGNRKVNKSMMDFKFINKWKNWFHKLLRSIVNFIHKINGRNSSDKFFIKRQLEDVESMEKGFEKLLQQYKESSIDERIKIKEEMTNLKRRLMTEIQIFQNSQHYRKVDEIIIPEKIKLLQKILTEENDLKECFIEKQLKEIKMMKSKFNQLQLKHARSYSTNDKLLLMRSITEYEKKLKDIQLVHKSDPKFEKWEIMSGRNQLLHELIKEQQRLIRVEEIDSIFNNLLNHQILLNSIEAKLEKDVFPPHVDTDQELLLKTKIQFDKLKIPKFSNDDELLQNENIIRSKFQIEEIQKIKQKVNQKFNMLMLKMKIQPHHDQLIQKEVDEKIVKFEVELNKLISNIRIELAGGLNDIKFPTTTTETTPPSYPIVFKLLPTTQGRKLLEYHEVLEKLYDKVDMMELGPYHDSIQLSRLKTAREKLLEKVWNEQSYIDELLKDLWYTQHFFFSN